MSDRTVKRLLESAPSDPAAEKRTWAVVRAAYAEREPVSAPPRRHLRVGLAFAAVAAAVIAAVVSPPGRAVVNAVRKSIGIAHAQPALFRLPSPGRVLVSGDGGSWVVSADGSKRRLGNFREASWSPHALFVVAASRNELATIEPGGTVHWTLARTDIRFPRWGGDHGDTRIAYLSGAELRVVAGDGTGDRAVAAAAPVAPAWRPGNGHVLAYVTAHDAVVLVDVDRHSTTRLPGTYGRPRLLAWAPSGKALFLVTARSLVQFDLHGARPRALPSPRANVSALAFSRTGQLAVLQGSSIRVAGKTVFATSAALSGLAWSPDGRWLLTELPAADQWVFVQAHAGRRVLAVSHLRTEFGGASRLDGWANGP